MAIVLNSWKNANSGGSATTTLAVNKPYSGDYDGGDATSIDPAIGDLLLIIVGNDEASDTQQFNDTSKPTGFTLIRQYGNTSYDCHLALYGKIVDGTEGSSFTCTAASSNEMWASCLLISGAENSLEHIFASTGSGDGTPAPFTMQTATAYYYNMLSIAFAAFDGADATFTWGNGWTERVEVASGTSGNYASGTWATNEITALGATSNPQVTADTSDQMCGFHVLIPPKGPTYRNETGYLVTSGDDGSAETPFPVDYPAYADGDFVAAHLSVNGSATITVPSTGPNGETIVTIYANHSSGTGTYASAFYWIGDGSHAAGTLNVTPSGAEQWVAQTALIKAGHFNSSSPIDSVVGTGGDPSESATAAPSPSWTPSSDSTVDNGLVVAWLAVDNDNTGTPPSGWETIITTDRGTIVGCIGQRILRATNNTSIASANWPITADNSSSLGYVIKMPVAVTNLDVDCTTTSRTRTTNASTVSKSRIVAAATEARTRTTYSATVNTSRGVAAATEARTRTVYAAVVDTDRHVAAGSAARTRTVYNATVTTAVGLEVDCTTTARLRSVYATIVDVDRHVAAASTARTRTVNTATVNTARAVAAASAARTRTVYNATVVTSTNLDVSCTSLARTRSTYAIVANTSRSVALGVASRQRSTFSASVSLNRNIAATTTARQRSILATTVSRDRSIAATVQGRARTLYNATVTFDVDLDVACTSAARARTVYNPIVTANLDIAAASVARQRTTYGVNISTGLTIDAAATARTRTTYSADITKDLALDLAVVARSRTVPSVVVNTSRAVALGVVARERTAYTVEIEKTLEVDAAVTARSRTTYSVAVHLPATVVTTTPKSRLRSTYPTIVAYGQGEPDWWDYTGFDTLPDDLGIAASGETFGIEIEAELLHQLVAAEATGANAIDEGLGYPVVTGDFWLWGDGSEMLWGDGTKIGM